MLSSWRDYFRCGCLRLRWGEQMKTSPLAVALILLVGFSVAAEAQRRDRRQPARQTEPPVTAALPDDQRIEGSISQMLAAWQVGDVSLLREHYADNVVVVSGAYEPPLIGWAAFAQGYLRLMQRMQGARLERRDTVIRTLGNVAWATYLWELQATVDGTPTLTRGHATLILEKQGERWLIVHNHTSLIAH